MNDAEMIRVLKGIKESLNDDILSHRWAYDGFCDWLAVHINAYRDAYNTSLPTFLIREKVRIFLFESLCEIYPYSPIGIRSYWFTKGHIDGRLKVIDHALNKLTCSKGTK